MSEFGVAGLGEFLLGGQWNNRAIEGHRDHFVHRLDEMELHLLADVGRDLLEIALVLGGEDDPGDAGAVPRRGSCPSRRRPAAPCRAA